MNNLEKKPKLEDPWASEKKMELSQVKMKKSERSKKSSDKQKWKTLKKVESDEVHSYPCRRNPNP
jgi:hypothetical protein